MALRKRKKLRATRPFLLIVGRSGSGKSTITAELERLYEIKSLKSFTTRPQRDENDDTHTFITYYESLAWLKKQYPNRIGETIYDGHMYFATVNQMTRCDTYVVDPAGIEYFRKHYTGKRPWRIVYIQCPEVLCVERMRKRGDSEEQIRKRIEIDREAFKNIKQDADFIVNNISLSAAVQAVYGYFERGWKKDGFEGYSRLTKEQRRELNKALLR